ncbi:PilZ domain-containing protein [Microvirga pakistanensis]|uniref:PilZ domain-containing protein n=1 Tax=Microvirga pakistanensis TaxID=1682650 RepID=UPI00106A8418|nr:PilZ domain-containing protein [Microvirga pakistanensis]
MKPVEQRRASPRSHTHLKGHIIFNNGLSRMECTVRDLSETGARLAFAHPVKVPAEFQLQIPGKKLIRRAQVIWYDGRSHGIMFLDRDVGADAPERLSLPDLEASGVSDILEEARQRIAQLLGVSVDMVQLKVAIER